MYMTYDTQSGHVLGPSCHLLDKCTLIPRKQNERLDRSDPARHLSWPGRVGEASTEADERRQLAQIRTAAESHSSSTFTANGEDLTLEGRVMLSAAFSEALGIRSGWGQTGDGPR